VAANPSQSARVSGLHQHTTKTTEINPSEGYEETLANLRPSSFLLVGLLQLLLSTKLALWMSECVCQMRKLSPLFILDWAGVFSEQVSSSRADLSFGNYIFTLSFSCGADFTSGALYFFFIIFLWG
jgi:hypothetical protein